MEQKQGILSFTINFIQDDDSIFAYKFNLFRLSANTTDSRKLKNIISKLIATGSAIYYYYLVTNQYSLRIMLVQPEFCNIAFQRSPPALWVLFFP